MDDMMTNDMQEDDQLLRELFQRSESLPGNDLKEKIMREVNAKQAVFEYQPVISRKVWIILAIGFVSLMVFLLSYDRVSIDPEWLDYFTTWSFPAVDVSLDMSLSLPDLPDTFTMGLLAVIVFGIYYILSISVLKKYHRSED